MSSQTWLLSVVTILSSWLLAVLSAWLAFWFTKRREYESDLRKIKLAQYQEFMRAISRISEGRSTSEAQAFYSDAYNNSQLVASPDVLLRLRSFQDEISIKNQNRSVDKEIKLRDELILSMRKDLFKNTKQISEGFTFGYISVPPSVD